jgi:phage gpG-like protein
MIGMRSRSRFDMEGVRRRADQGSFRSLAHAAAAIRLTARRSIRRSKSCSAPGTPPHTRRGLLRGAIVYGVEKYRDSAVIGPTYERVGTSAMAHEFGGRYRKERYPKRPFMGPALEKLTPRLPGFWAHSVG